MPQLDSLRGRGEVMQQQMLVENYEVFVHLGCEPEERRYTQPVRVSLTLDFSKPLPGALSDSLQDTVDYVALTRILKETAEKKEYKLIEHLNECMRENLTAYLVLKNFNTSLKIQTRKVRVPVDHLRDGVVFTCISHV